MSTATDIRRSTSILALTLAAQGCADVVVVGDPDDADGDGLEDAAELAGIPAIPRACGSCT